jgi:hypothetical protein
MLEEWGVPKISNPWLHLRGFYFGNAMPKDVTEHIAPQEKKNLKICSFYHGEMNPQALLRW